MKSEEAMERIDGIPVSPLLHEERRNKYGSVPGLDDEELADPDELERQVHRGEFGPILALPLKGIPGSLKPAIDESGGIDWGAFATVNFERVKPALDKARYKADMLREERNNVLLLLGNATRHVQGDAKYLVLKLLDNGVIGLDHIVDPDMVVLAGLYLRARRLQHEIGELREVSRKRQRMEMAELFA